MIERECIVCKKMFMPKSGTSRHCSIKCSNISYRQYTKEWYKKNKTKVRKKSLIYYNKIKNTDQHRLKNKFYHLKKTYNITEEEFNRLLKLQENKCPICKKSLIDKNITACIDHNHDTGKIRGILCRLCNVGLGAFSDNLDTLKNATQYMEQYNEQN